MMLTRTLVLAGVMVVFGPSGLALAQPIIDYVNAPDDSFAWEVERAETLGTVEVTHLKLTSQTWRDVVWTHRVQLLVPESRPHPETAVMLIVGGSPDETQLRSHASAAVAVSAPLVILGDIPNQPLFGGRTEDALIALTFSNYLESGEADWPLLFPMTKAAVRAMDALEEYTAAEWERPISSWVVTGGSKRGWTTWFTGAVVPERLRGIIPVAYDNLNLPEQMRLHITAWGEYSAMIQPYTERGLPDLLTAEEGQALAAMVDPYTLRDRIDIPQLTITGTNDAYWPLDAANLYWDDLNGANSILYVPNSGHDISDERLYAAQAGFFKACTGRGELPNPTWEFDETDGLRIVVDPGETLPLLRVTQWRAHSPTRDFRPAEWTQAPAAEEGGRYIAQIGTPEEGFSAIFAEIVYELDGRPFPLSTNVRIIKARE